MSALIRLEKLSRIYSTGEVEVRAVHEVSLEIARGDFVAIMGASGSGKSTLMYVLGCLDWPTSGHYWLDGVDVSEFDHDELADIRSQKIGFVFQSFNLLARTSALENVELPMLYRPDQISTRKQREQARHALELVGLSDRTHHYPNQLS